MEWQHIEALVEKYWEGETTLAEEATLREALTRPDVPESLRREAELMGYWQAESERTLSPTRDHALQRVHLMRHEEATARPARTIKINPFWARIAATVVIAAGLILFNMRNGMSVDPLGDLLSLQEEVATPEETYNEVRDALLFISLKFKQGAEPMENLQEINHAQQPLQQLKNFNRAEEIIEDKND